MGLEIKLDGKLNEKERNLNGNKKYITQEEILEKIKHYSEAQYQYQRWERWDRWHNWSRFNRYSHH